MGEISSLSAFVDNYIFCFRNQIERESQIFIVDPGDEGPVSEWLAGVASESDLSPNAPLHILLTHKHPDHIGGLAQLWAWLKADDRFKSSPISIYSGELTRKYAKQVWPEMETIWFGQWREVRDGEKICGDLFQVIVTPGHTLDHVSYYSQDLKALFCGDVLFGLGCGRLFEGTPEMMMDTLHKIAALPPTTQVFCAHEYTETNFHFAKKILPEAELAQVRTELDRRWREKNKTIPSQLDFEIKFNPFLRESNLKAWTELRQARNHFSAVRENL